VDLSGDLGTYVNGERVTDRLLLMDRDRIRLGESVEFTYHDGSAPDESRVRRWVKRIGTMASKTGWKS
jgi:pSer/pThr/pTyr-binding forkhead associated (FHA) protein